MSFALLFILAFLVGITIYHFKRNWWFAVVTPLILFILSVLVDSVDKQDKVFSLVFGAPIIFFAALLGAYIYQIRLIDTSDCVESGTDFDEQSDQVESE